MATKSACHMSPDEFDFSECDDPSACAQAFVERIDGSGIEVAGECVVEFWAEWSPDNPSKVYVGSMYTEGHAEDGDAREAASQVIWQAYRACCRPRSAGQKSKDRSSANHTNRRHGR